MVVKLVRDEAELELDGTHLRALVTAVFDAQRAAYSRSHYARREGREEQAQQHLTNLGRLQRLADFLVARDDATKET